MSGGGGSDDDGERRMCLESVVEIRRVVGWVSMRVEGWRKEYVGRGSVVMREEREARERMREDFILVSDRSQT